MRKWICVGVLGGLLEFGIIYSVAFSEADPPPKQTVKTPKGSPTKSALSARATVRKAEIPAPVAAVPAPGSPAPVPVAAVPAVASAAAPPPAAPAARTPAAAEVTVPGPPASEVKIQLDKVLPLPGTPPEPVKVPVPADLSTLPIEDIIRAVFGPEGEKAVQVARCESTLRPHAKKGQFLGLFQMGANERVEYGHGEDALAQVLAAHALFLDRGWQPWTCA
jgi:hypothetical protein